MGTAGICLGLCLVSDLEGDTKVRGLLKQKREQGWMTNELHKLESSHEESEIQRGQLRCVALKEEKLTLQVQNWK